MTVEEMFEGEDEDVRGEVSRLFRGRGLRAAALALIEVAENPKAQASARATAAGFILRATGVLDTRQDDAGKPPEEMTPAELNAEIKRIRRDLNSRLGLADETCQAQAGSMFD